MVRASGARRRTVARQGMAAADGGAGQGAAAPGERGDGGLGSSEEEGTVHARAIGWRLTDGGGLRRPVGGGKRRRRERKG
jgi:hypothetical protein